MKMDGAQGGGFISSHLTDLPRRGPAAEIPWFVAALPVRLLTHEACRSSFAEAPHHADGDRVTCRSAEIFDTKSATGCIKSGLDCPGHFCIKSIKRVRAFCPDRLWGLR